MIIPASSSSTSAPAKPAAAIALPPLLSPEEIADMCVYALDVHERNMKLLRLDPGKLGSLIRDNVGQPLAEYTHTPGPEGRESLFAAMRALCERQPKTDAERYETCRAAQFLGKYCVVVELRRHDSYEAIIRWADRKRQGVEKLGWKTPSRPDAVAGRRKRKRSPSAAGAPSSSSSSSSNTHRRRRVTTESDLSPTTPPMLPPPPPPATEQVTTQVFKRPLLPLRMRRVTSLQLAEFRRDPCALLEKRFVEVVEPAAAAVDNAGDDDDGGAAAAAAAAASAPRRTNLYFEIVGMMTLGSKVMHVMFEGSRAPDQRSVADTLELIARSCMVEQ